MSCNSAVALFIWGSNLMRIVHDWELESTSLFQELPHPASVRGFGERGGGGNKNGLERI